MKKIQFTKEGFEKLKQEYDELTSKKKHQAIDRLQKARAMGDLSENSEYTAAKEDLAFVEGRVRELEELLANADIVDVTADQGAIVIGCKVKVETSGQHHEFMIVGEFEADPTTKKLSHTSPIGKALLGKKVGDKVEVSVPAGKMVYKIMDIRNE